MKAVTLRNLPPELVRIIQRKARENRTSVNRAVISLLEEATGVGKRKEEVVHHDLDRFFGCWSKEEAEEIAQAIREQRQIDAEMWK